MYDVIFNKNSLKIIKLLRGGKQYFNQLSENGNITSKNSLLKSLNGLCDLGVLKKEKNKSNTFYSLNYDNSLTVSILLFVDKLFFESLSFSVKGCINEIISMIKPNILVLFGSYAKGNITKYSDVDLLVIADKKINNYKIKEMALRYGVNISTTIMRFSEFNILNESLNHVIKTGHPIVGGEYFYNEFKKI